MSTARQLADLLDANGDVKASALDNTTATPEGTAVKSTGEGGGTKFLREDGDNTSSWQTISQPVLDSPSITGTLFVDSGSTVSHTISNWSDDVTYVITPTNCTVGSVNSSGVFVVTHTSGTPSYTIKATTDSLGLDDSALVTKNLTINLSAPTLSSPADVATLTNVVYTITSTDSNDDKLILDMGSSNFNLGTVSPGSGTKSGNTVVVTGFTTGNPVVTIQFTAEATYSVTAKSVDTGGTYGDSPLSSADSITVVDSAYGDSSWGNVTLATSGITQTGHTVAVSTIFRSTSVGESSYSEATPTSNVYELTATDIGSTRTCRDASGTHTTAYMDGDMVVANFQDLTINSGVTLTTDHPCRGLLIFVSGNLTLNGTISMTARGAFANASGTASSDSAAVNSAGITISLPTSSGSSSTLSTFTGSGNNAVNADFGAASSDRTLWSIPKTGGSGGAGTPSGGTGGAGGTSTNGTGGGGGAGSGWNNEHGGGGGGNNGTCFSGAPGGAGGTWRCSSTPQNDGGSGEDNGGAGGAGGINESSSECYRIGEGGGGAGNPAGYNGRFNTVRAHPGVQGTNSTATIGVDGTGGLLIVVVTGNITGSGTLSSQGSAGGDGDMAYGYDGGGGGSGGGVVAHFYGGTSSSPTISVAGGAKGVRSPGGGCSSTCGDGGAGGAGSSITSAFVST